jgi:hypothetical protein
VKAVEQGKVCKEDVILLNVSGGYKRIAEDYGLCRIKPSFGVSLDIPLDEIQRECL